MTQALPLRKLIPNLTPEQDRFLLSHPGCQEMAIDLYRRYGEGTARRYLDSVMDTKKPSGKPSGTPAKSCNVYVRDEILEHLEAGPKSRAELVALGVDAKLISRNLQTLKRQGLICSQGQAGSMRYYHLIEVEEVAS